MKRHHLLAIFILLVSYIFANCGGADKEQISSLSPKSPFPPSPVIESITWDFDNLIRKAPGSDLWPITWAADDNLYTSWGDGGGFGGTNKDGRVSLGFARIEGSPENFVGHNVWGGKNAENPAQFGGKSIGILSVDGVLYAWVNMQNGDPPDNRLAWSSDLAKTWQLANDWKFPEDDFLLVSFLNFGKDYADARDGFVYMYGESLNDNNQYLARVPKDQIKNRALYEFFKGLDANGNPLWESDITQRQPVFTDPNSVVGAHVVFNPGIERYILTVSHGGVGKLGIFDAPEPWGPWTAVAYYEDWGGFGTGVELGYHIPTKWISPNGKTMWMVFSSVGELDSFHLLRATLVLKEP